MVPTDETPARLWTDRRALAIVLAVGLMAWTASAAGLDTGHIGVVLDDGIYLASAQALRDGKGYELPSRPGDPPPKYPVGLPSAIALALWLAPGDASLARDIAVARGVVLISGWTFALAAFAWLRRLRVDPWVASLVILATMFHHVTLVGCATTIFADLPFCAVTYLLLARWAVPGWPKASVRSAFADGLLAGVACLLRGNGITLVLASLVASGLGTRRWVRILACTLGLSIVLVVLPTTIDPTPHARRVPSGDYMLELRAGWSSAASGLKVVTANVRSMALDFAADVVLPNATYTAPIVRLSAAHPWVSGVLRAAVGLVTLLGALRLARAGRRCDIPTWLHVTGTLAIFAVWPWNMVMDRFLLGLFPMALLAFGLGTSDLARRLGAARPIGRLSFRLALTLALAGSLSVAARSVLVFHAEGRQWRGAGDRKSLALALDYLRAAAEPNAVVAANWPETVFLYAGRQAIPLVEDDDVVAGRFGRRDRIRLWMNQAPARPFYLLLRSLTDDPPGIDARQAAALANDPALALHEVFRTPDGRFRIDEVIRR